MRTSPIVDQRLAQLQFQDRFQEAEHARRGAQLPRRSHPSAVWKGLRASIAGSWALRSGISIAAQRAASKHSLSVVSGGD